MLGGALDGQQQREQSFAVPRAGILLQSLAERQMLSLGLGRKPYRVGCQKRKRGVRVFAILREVEMNTPHQVPGRMTTLEELLHCELGLHQLWSVRVRASWTGSYAPPDRVAATSPSIVARLVV
jgi:hypothetical protein